MPYATIGKVNLYYEEAGNGVPVLLAHGGFSNISEWASQVSALSYNYRVIRYDRRGCGLSTPKEVENTPQLWVEDQRILIEALELERPVIGGVSYGGMLLIEFLLKHQDLCRAAIIVSATASGYSCGPVPFPDRRAELARITTPTLVVQGSHDTVFPPGHGETIASRMPNAQIVTLKGGHTINNQRAEAFNQAALIFLTQVT
jgi:pimeloyl-ACP methyl ester carboxylesterase